MSSMVADRQGALADYSMPVVGVDGSLGSVGGKALRDSLKRGSVAGVMDLLKSMNAQGVVQSLREAGFAVAPELAVRGKSAIFAGVQSDLSAAIDLPGDGFDLSESRLLKGAVAQKPFAAKVNPTLLVRDKPLAVPVDFPGDADAAAVIQRVMRSSAVAVSLLGVATPGLRGSLLLVAGQALKKGIQGFGFDGIEGKYQVPLSMSEVLELHKDAARAVAQDSTRVGLGSWAAGEKVNGLDSWVPDSVQRLLHGSVTLESAQALVQAIESGMVGLHASAIGEHEFTGLLAAQGLDTNAPPLAEQAEAMGFVIQPVDRDRSQYFGMVLALDYRAALVKTSRVNAIELPFVDLPEGHNRPKMGDSLRLSYKNGELSIAVAERSGREGGR